MEPTDITIVVLREIRDELRGLKEGQTEMRDEIRQTNERLDRHERALGLLIGEVRNLGSRIDNLVTGPMGEKVRDLDRRVATLESRAGIGQP